MSKIAIVGMDAVFGSCQNLDELANGTYAGKQYFESAPVERCQGLQNGNPTGAYLKSFKIDALQLKISPETLNQIEPQQLLLLKVIFNALKQVCLDASAKGVILMDNSKVYAERVTAQVVTPVQERVLESTIASRLGNQAIAPQLKPHHQKHFITNQLDRSFNISTLTLEPYENTFKALKTAQTLLTTGEASFVVVSATHFMTHLNSGDLGTATLSYDLHANGVHLGEGAGAVVLKSYEAAREGGDRIYATLDAVSFVQNVDSSGAIAQSCQQAFYAAGVNPADIGYLEVSAAGDAQEDETELSGLAQAYRGQSSLSCAIGSVKANVGHTGTVCDLAGIIKTALCLYHRYIPTVPQWTVPKHPKLWQDSPFYVPTDSRPWLLDETQDKRIAAVNSRCGHLILSEDLEQGDRPNTYLHQLPGLLFAIAAADQPTLLEELDALQKSIANTSSLTQLAHHTFTVFQQQAQAAYVVAIVGQTQEKLLREIERARSGIPRAFTQGEAWKSPAGSYFTANPLGQQGTVAFVYPGAFNSYLGMGRSLFHLFPQLHDCANRLTSNPSQFLQEKQLYPRSVHRLPKRELEALESRFSDTPLALLETGTGFSVLFTEIIQQIFGVQPSAAFGYSMGESTMLYALKVWDNADYGSHFVHSSQLFHSRLGGIQEAVQEYWEIPQCCAVPENMVPLSAVLSDTGSSIRSNTILSTVTEQPCERTSWPQRWSSHVLLASPAAVKECLRSSDRVYLTHINTPQEVVIAGEPQACQRVINTLQCESFRMPSNLVLHCEAMASEYPALFKLNHVPTFNPSRVTFYSSATYSPLPLDQIFVAHHLAKGVCQKLDFPRLVNRVYADGAKIFIELGSGGTCSRWIDQILDSRDHVSICINRRGIDDYTSILKVLAQLVSHRVPVDLSSLYTSTLQPSSQSATQTISLNQYSLIQNGSQPAQPTALKRTASPQPMPGSEQQSLPTSLDTAEILELTEQKVSRIFGKDFTGVDTYARRVRLPSPPYLLISRVTHLEGERGNYKTGVIQTEYDLPQAAWYSVDGQIPIGICAEAGHGILLLLSYLGADFESQGDRSFRLLDLTVEFLTEQPENLTTLTYNVKINAHVKTTESLLIFFSGECRVGDRPWLKLSGGCAGLFTDEELAKGQGIVVSEQEERARQQIQKKTFTPLLNCPKVSFTQSDLQRLSQGDLTVFGAAYHANGRNPSLRLPPQQLMMIDRVVSVDPQGGVAGLGLVMGTKTVTPQDWYFQCHFKNDPTMPGSLMVEGSSQLLQYYLLFLGLQTCTQNAKFDALPEQPFGFRFRGQVTPATGTLTYQLEVTELKVVPKVCAIATINLIWAGKTIATIKNLGLQLSEQAPLSQLLSPPNQSVLFNAEQLKELAQGSVEACLGAEFHGFKNRRSVRIPNREFCLISRVLDIKGQRHAFQKGTTLTTEYDVSPDAWFYRDNAYPALPYCAHIEIAGQPCIFLGLELGTTLLFPDEDLYFRNLDGQAQALKEVDLRGRTITNQVELLASTALEGATLQTFAYQLACEGEPFYRGTMVFGYFSHRVLASQVGLDGGKVKQPWYQTHAVTHLNSTQIDLDSPIAKKQFYPIKSEQPHYRLANGYLNFLNRALIIEAGGNYQKGYIYAEKEIEPSDWYFPYHFYQDPVMPGALGVESILQAMQVYALHQNLGKSLKSPRFGQALNHTITWKYRGQITPQNRKIYLEVHLSDVRHESDRITLIGDASLWKETMRIYEVKNIAICLQEAGD